MPSTDPDALLRTWRQLNDFLRSTSDDRALLPLLRRAVELGVRAQVLERVYQRYSRLRWQREHSALLDAALSSREGKAWEFPL